MSLMKIADFQKMAGLSDASMLWLLNSNRLRCELSQDGAILVDTASAGLPLLIESIAARQRALIQENESLIAERFGRIICDNVEEIFREAILRATEQKYSAQK